MMRSDVTLWHVGEKVLLLRQEIEETPNFKSLQICLHQAVWTWKRLTTECGDWCRNIVCIVQDTYPWQQLRLINTWASISQNTHTRYVY